MRSERILPILWEFISLSALSLVLGIGIGFFQGELSTSGQLGEIRMVLPNEGAFAGALWSLPTGWIAYYVILRRRLSFKVFRDVIGITFLFATAIGTAVGYLTHGGAAFASSVLMIPIVLVTVGMVAARSSGSE